MELSGREKFAAHFCCFTIGFPAFIASGFLPQCNILPIEGWFAFATLGTALIAMIATPKWIRGGFSGALAGAGGFSALCLYPILRTVLTQSDQFIRLELILATGVGALPGFLLFMFCARDVARKDTWEESPNGWQKY